MGSYDPELIEKLTAINLEDMLISFGWQNVRFGRRALAWPFKDLARRFARQVLDYDNAVRTSGLHAGSKQFLGTLLKSLIIEGQEHIPLDGPVLFLSNHPGMTDTVALFASIPRTDLRIVAADRPFLRALPGTHPLLIYVSEDATVRLKAMRAISNYLRSGGSVLTFPGGEIEPDPAVLPGAVEALATWSTSIGVFARSVPGLRLVPVIVSGVLAPKATLHPLTYIRRYHKDRERLGATLQILASVFHPRLWRALWHVSVHVRFIAPIQASELLPLQEPGRITQAVVERMTPFMNAVVGREYHS